MSTQFKFEVFEREQLNPLKGHALTKLEEFIAALLFKATSASPMQIAHIIIAVGNQFGDWPGDREVKQTVRSLRKEHGFPILSRKGKPAGYWWCASPGEMNDFIADWRKQALDEMHTLSKVVKHNYPELAGQLTLEDIGR